MPRVAEIQTALVGSFVGTVLQRDDGIAGAQLFIGELARVLLGFLGSDRRLAELGALESASRKTKDTTMRSLDAGLADADNSLVLRFEFSSFFSIFHCCC